MIKILLDTNIIVYRESDNVYKFNIGVLYNIIDNNPQMIKFIHPVIKKELLQNIYDLKRNILLERLKSYNLLPKTSRVSNVLKSKTNILNKDENDDIDDEILNELFIGNVDYLITEDKKIKKKALILGLKDRVKSISEFIFENKVEKSINHNILDIKKVRLGTLNIKDTFFDDLKSNYLGFEEWFYRKKEKYGYAYMENNKLLALLILKNEEIGDDTYNNIKPNMRFNRKLKVSTFKVDIEHKKIGERFMKIIFDQAIFSMVDEIYVTIFDNDSKKINLIKYLEKFGFEYFGKKDEKELVYVRTMKKVFNNEFPTKSYPFFNSNNDNFIIAINPEYHTFLLPDSKLIRESYSNIHLPVEYAINKFFISRAGWSEKPKIGDNIIFYRTKQENIPAKYSSVLTTIGVVTNIYIPKDVEDLIKKVNYKSVYTHEQLRKLYCSNLYIIEFVYITTLINKINYDVCEKNGILSEFPRGVLKIGKHQFKKILELGEVDNSIVI